MKAFCLLDTFVIHSCDDCKAEHNRSHENLCFDFEYNFVTVSFMFFACLGTLVRPLPKQPGGSGEGASRIRPAFVDVSWKAGREGFKSKGSFVHTQISLRQDFFDLPSERLW